MRRAPVPPFRGLAFVVACVMSAACGAGQPSAASTPGSSAGGGTATAPADAGPKDSEPPFAGSTAEATELISAAVDSKHRAIRVCVRDFRTRRTVTHTRVTVSFGIDQDGRLLGVTSKGKEDTELKACIQDALKGAPFPRSHAGVITVTKTYEDILL